MASIWNAPSEIALKLSEIKTEHHPVLEAASFWLLATDANHIRDNRVITAVAKKTTKHEKLANGKDFKITIYMEAWLKLTDEQREVALDEALCSCGVKYMPMTAEVNGKRVVVKDDLGRTVYTDDIAHTESGEPKWCIVKPDAAVCYEMIQRHGVYSEDVRNIKRVLDGKDPLGINYDPHQMKMDFVTNEEIEDAA